MTARASRRSAARQGVSQQTYYRWRKKYAGLMPSEVQPPEAARGRERTSEADGGGSVSGQGHAAGCYPPKALRPAKGRELVDDLRGVWQVSIRRACSVLNFERSTYHYKSRRPSQAGLRKRIREIAETRVRYGYRREYNEERPHSAIGNKTPVEFMKSIGQPSRAMV